MARGPAPVYCDHCNKLKGPENHWYHLWVGNENTFGITNWSDPPQINANTTDNEKVMDLCGEECLFKELSILLLGKQPKADIAWPKAKNFPGDPVGDCKQ